MHLHVLYFVLSTGIRGTPSGRLSSTVVRKNAFSYIWRDSCPASWRSLGDTFKIEP